MNLSLRLFFVATLIMAGSISLWAQQLYTVNGIVRNDKGEPIAGATVFLGNTQKITSSTDSGLFVLGKLTPGTFQLVVKMMGYAPYSANIIVSADIPMLTVTMHDDNPVDLNEVKIITTNPLWDDEYNLFKDNFLGSSKNGRNCKIINPKIITFKYNKSRNVLEGHTKDFLIIENPILGYRLKYLLRAFEFKFGKQITNYDGDMIFEELQGSEEQQKKWQKNRLKTYYGSLTNYLRSVYSGKDEPLHEGFVTRKVLDQGDLMTDARNVRSRPDIVVDTHPIRYDTLVSVVDSSLISLKFHSPIMIIYKGRKLLKEKPIDPYQRTAALPFSNHSSILQLVLKEALIDSKGNFTNFRAFLIRGYWAEMRVGDQLPVDYQP